MNALQTTDQTQDQSIVPADVNAGALQAALAGDLAKLTGEDRLKFYGALCNFTGLNPLSKPFDWIQFQGKLTLYPNKGCAEQLRKIHKITFDDAFERKAEFGLLIVTVRGTDRDGRRDFATAALPFDDKMAPDVRANALMKCETKAKRRFTLSIAGLTMFARDIEDSDVQPSHEQNIAQIETASDRAAELNRAINPPIEVEEIKEPKLDPDGVAATPEIAAQVAAAIAGEELPFGQPIEPKPEQKPEPKPASTGLTGPDGLLTQETAARIQEVFFAETPFKNDPKDYVGFLIHRGALKPGQGLEHLAIDKAQKILQPNTPIHRWVSDWAKTKGKA